MHGSILGFSIEYSYLLDNVLNVSIGYISTLFYLVFDDLFEMVISTKDADNVLNEIFNDLIELNSDQYSEYEHDDNGKLIYRPPPLEDICLDEQGRLNLRHEFDNQLRRRDDRIHENNHVVPDIIPLAKGNYAMPHTGAPVSDDESSVDYLLEHSPI